MTSDGGRHALPDVAKLLYIAFAFGTSLAVNVAIFAEISGGKFNPAVSFPSSLFIFVSLYLPLFLSSSRALNFFFLNMMDTVVGDGKSL